MNANQLNPFNRIVQEVERSEASRKSKFNLPAEKVVVADKRRRVVLPKIPLLHGKNITYHIVFNTNNASNIVERKKLLVNVTDFENDKNIELFRYLEGVVAWRRDSIQRL